jgi:hypothetical protein
MTPRNKEGKDSVAADHGSIADMDGKPANGKITEVQGNSTFMETVTAAPLNPRSKTSFQLYAILLVAALNATASGFDGVSASGASEVTP